MPGQDVLKKYNDVKLSLENAIATSDNIKMSGEEENSELTYIRNTLNQLNADFIAEIERLEASSEWDRFCMAFFGETNAGKSTIIEALRIVYDEESRREEIYSQREQFNVKILEEKEEYADLITVLNALHNMSRERFFGITTLVEILKGYQNEKIYRYELNMIPEYGALNKVPTDIIKAVIEWMISEHYMLKTKQNYPLLHPTNEGIHYSETITEKKLKNLKEYLEKDFMSFDTKIGGR